MVDNLSTEEIIEKLLEETRKYSYPEDTPGIKRRYKDTALVLVKESLEDEFPRNYLTFGSRRSSSVSQYGNTPIVIRRSRSSNGGLAMVAEQVPSLKGRTSRSDYALVEAKERDDDSDSDYYNISQSRSHIDGASTIDDDQSVTIDTGSISPSSQIQDLNSDEHHSQGIENKKSFSHYDLNLQHHLEDITEASSSQGEDELGKKGGTVSSSVNDKKSSIDTDNNPQNPPGAEIEASHKNSSHLFNNNEEELERKRHLAISETTIDIPDIDHEAVLREYVEGTFLRNKLKEDSLDTTKKEGDEYIELKIVEPADLCNEDSEEICPVKRERTLTAIDIMKYKDDDDVVFIDANSPPLPRTKFSCSSTGSVPDSPRDLEDLGCSIETTDTPAKRRSKSYGESSSNLNDFIKEEEKCPANNNDKGTPVLPTNALHRLPVRKPTPPKKSPMRSPRVPKVKQKNMSSDEELPVYDFHNGTRSASPVSKEKDSKFSFSLKREKSKSSSYLHTKKGKEKKKLSLVHFHQDEPTVTKSPDQTKDETNGKRVGIRNIAIDGTIKRNFIVIHPSDDSDTIGLAPVTPTNSKVASGTTSPALSSVKSRIIEINHDKLVQKISYEGNLKEELSSFQGHSDTAKNSKNYSRFDRIYRSLRLKEKTGDRKTLGSSKSLSSDPSISGISEFASKSSCVLSEVDCDSVHNIPTQNVQVKSNTPVSALCVVQ